MLNRSFKPAKCKTSLKLASSRIKLLKNKKEVQVKQMKRELAQLLESGQDQTARIRVEHVVREEKTMAAFELLEIYCELIVARLPIIESQKNCPIDLKEAITSVIFASPRCADLPELQDVRKHFTAKYGKEFINAAIELRPDCGVSRMLVEKLSAKAPDGQTKIKILTAIAEEHKIKWDPKSFGEKELKPPDDLLNGPNTFEKASKMRTEPQIIQPPPSEVQAPSSLAQMNNASVNFEHNARSSASSDNFASTDIGGTQTTVQGTSHPGVRPSGTGSDRMEVRHSYYGDRQNWNMEFKDATAAAQAAAESAERASMAARAAAELSSRGKISRQYSTESHKSNNYSSRDEGLTENAASKLPTQQFAKNSGHNLFQDRNPQKQTEQVDSPEHDNLDEAAENVYRDGHGHGSSKRSGRSASVDEGAPMNDICKAGGYQQKSLFEEKAVKTEKSPVFSEMSTKKLSIGSEVEFVSGQQSDNFSYFGEERIAKKASSVSSRSHSRNHSDGYDVSPSSHQKFESDVVENPFVGIDKGNTHSDAVHTSYYNDAPVVFDDPVSDDDLRFDTLPKYDRQESLYSASPPKELPSYISANIDTWSPRQNISGSDDQFSSVSHVSAERYFPPVFDESLTKSSHPSQQEDLLPVTFDESEGPSSESEDELHQSRLGVKTDHVSQPNKESNLFSSPYDIHTKSHGLTGSFLAEKDDSGSNRKQELHYSSDEEELVEVSSKINPGTEFSAQSHRKFGFDEVPTRQSSSKLTKPQINSDEKPSEPFYSHVEERKSWLSPQTSRLSLAHEAKDTPALSDTMRDDESFEQLSLESGKELNFGTLTGGLRNKGYRRPPYTKSPSGDASVSRKAGEISVTPIEHPSVSPPVVKSSLNPGVSTNVKNKSSFRTPTAEDDSDTDDSDEEDPQQNSRSEREQHGPKASKDVYAKSRLRAPVTFFDDNDPEEDLPKQAFTSSVRAGSGLSRRTKATPSSGTSSFSKMPLSSKINHEPQSQTDIDAKNEYSRSSYRSATPPEARSQTDAADAKRMSSRSSNRSETPPEPQSQTDADAKRMSSRSSNRSETPTPPEPQSQADADAKNVPSRSSYRSKTPPKPWSQTDADAQRMPRRSSYPSQTPLKPHPQTTSLDHWENSPELNTDKQGTSKPNSESNSSVRKENLKSSTVQQPSSPLKTVTSAASTESPKTSTSSGEAPSREGSLKKASHVHPKLPDYDTIAAHLQSLRANHQ